MTETRTALLQQIVEQALESCLRRFADVDLRPDELAVSLVDIRNPGEPAHAGYRAQAQIYPASVIKLFFAVAAYEWVREGKLSKTAEFDRAMRGMIVESSNDATSYIVDLLTGTTSGPELSPEQMSDWSEKRNIINRFFHARNFSSLNANQKPWGDGPYGRERVFVGANRENKNILTAAETARLLVEIVSQRATAPEYCTELLSYMKRDRARPPFAPDDQTHDFVGANLPPDAKFWSKAGWTTTVRHDALYVEAQQGSKFVLVVFTVNHSKQPEILSSLGSDIASRIIQGP